MSLILKKDYEAITIKEICDAANVGRPTFYAHYTSKDDLKRSGLEHLRGLLVDRQWEALAKRGEASDRSLSFSLISSSMPAIISTSIARRSAAAAATSPLARYARFLSELVREELTVRGDGSSADAIPREVVVQYVVGAYMAVLTWWLDGGAKLPPQRIDAMFRCFATEGIVPSDC